MPKVELFTFSIRIPASYLAWNQRFEPPEQFCGFGSFFTGSGYGSDL
jgi:hypothetical protein